MADIQGSIMVERHIHLPTHKVKPAATESKIWYTDGEDTEEEFVSSKSVSTYPILPGRNDVRDGDPIADRLFCSIAKNRTIVAVADGCNWGVRPQQAAISATLAFKEYLGEKHKEIRDVQDAGHFLYRAFSEAHKKIIEGKEDIWEAGTTTLLGGMCLELQQEKEDDPQWGFVCASVGDCKAYRVSRRTGMVTDVTAGNRLCQKDAKDPGGRLGPYIFPQGDPDLRNLKLYWMPCEEGDIIIIVSDGVHDNLDPETLGKSPKEFSLDTESWDDVEKMKLEQIKTEYRNKMIENLLKDSPLTPTHITNALMRHCVQLTRNAREYMETHPNSNQPKDYVNYPGKMDHTTCVSFLVGTIEALSLSPRGKDEEDEGGDDNSKTNLLQNDKTVLNKTSSSDNVVLNLEESAVGDKRNSTGSSSASPDKDKNNSKSKKSKTKKHEKEKSKKEEKKSKEKQKGSEEKDRKSKKQKQKC